MTETTPTAHQALMTHLDLVIAENRQVFHDDASVAVQFSAGAWNKLKTLVESAKAELAAALVPNPAVGGPVVGATDTQEH